MNVIEAKNITKTYAIEEHELDVLADVSLAVAEGEFLVVQGSSGSGKSTLLSLLSGLDKPTSGRVTIRETDITDIARMSSHPFETRRSALFSSPSTSSPP